MDMKIIFEATKGRLKEVEKYEKAINIIENESMQGFFKSRHDSDFKKFTEKSPFEDGKKIVLYIVKVYGRGVYKLIGNLGYNGSTKQIKFYTTSVEELSKFNYDDDSLVEFFNDGEGTFRDHTNVLERIITKLKKTKPKPSNNSKQKIVSIKKKKDPRRTNLSDSQKAKKEKKHQSKNYKTDSRRKISNNKKQRF